MSNLRIKLPFTELEKTFKKNKFGEGKQEFCFGHVRLEILLDTKWR